MFRPFELRCAATPPSKHFFFTLSHALILVTSIRDSGSAHTKQFNKKNVFFSEIESWEFYSSGTVGCSTSTESYWEVSGGLNVRRLDSLISVTFIDRAMMECPIEALILRLSQTEGFQLQQ